MVATAPPRYRRSWLVQSRLMLRLGCLRAGGQGLVPSESQNVRELFWKTLKRSKLSLCLVGGCCRCSCFLFLLFFIFPPCKHISCFSRGLGESKVLFYSRISVAEIFALACARRFTWRYEAVEATDRQVPGTCTCTSVVQHVVRITEFNRGRQ